MTAEREVFDHINRPIPGSDRVRRAARSAVSRGSSRVGTEARRAGRGNWGPWTVVVAVLGIIALGLLLRHTAVVTGTVSKFTGALNWLVSTNPL